MRVAGRSFTLSVASVVTMLLASRAATAVTITEFPLQTAGTGPLGIAAGSDGNLWFTEYKWFTEYSSNKIGRITTDGIITEFPIPTAGSQPVGIASGPDGNLWFTESIGNKIGRITTDGVITEFPLPAGGPFGICLGPDGALWFTELSANKIGRITTAGTITEFTLPAGGEPWMIASGPDGNLWFTEFSGGKIGRISTAGTIAEFPLPTAGSQAYWIAAGPDGNLWFTENIGHKIGRITPAGDITEFPLPAGGNALGICLGPDGNLWFTENANPAKIGRITTSGVITEFTVPTADSLSEGICLGPGGTLWFTEFFGDKIGRITSPYLSAEPAGIVEDAYVSSDTVSNVNGVLEPGETVLVNPSWKNITASPLALTGTAWAFTGPAGAIYTLLDTTADYGIIAPGATADSFSAGGPSYRLTVSNPATRPATHWDATFLETLSTSDGKTWTLHVGNSFTDVPVSNGAYRFVETLLHNGITAGCGGGNYCPASNVTRWQMAVFLAISMAGSGAAVPVSGSVSGVGSYNCTLGGTSLFGDVLPTDGGCRFIHYIYAGGVTAGCGGGNYCPASNVTRWQMAPFLVIAFKIPLLH